MKKMFLFLGFVMLANACIVEEDEPEPVPPTPIDTTTDDSTDAGTDAPVEEHADISLCGVEIRFVFKYNEGTEVQFKNGNDTTVLVYVDSDTTGADVVDNCLWPDGEDNETAKFSKGEQLYVSVWKGVGDVLQYTCLDFFGDVFDTYELCDELVVVIQ